MFPDLTRMPQGDEWMVHNNRWNFHLRAVFCFSESERERVRGGGGHCVGWDVEVP